MICKNLKKLNLSQYLREKIIPKKKIKIKKIFGIAYVTWLGKKEISPKYCYFQAGVLKFQFLYKFMDRFNDL